MILTCNSRVSGFEERPLPLDGRRVNGTRVGDVGAVFLVGPSAASIITFCSTDEVLHPSGLTVEIRALCGYFLPLKPAGKRRVIVEVKVPAPAVLLGHLLQLQLQVPAQLLVVHGAKQTPASRLSAPDGIHPSESSGEVLLR